MTSIECDIITIMKESNDDGWVPNEGDYYSMYVSGGHTRVYQYYDDHWVYLYTLLLGGGTIDELDHHTSLDDDFDDYDDY